MFNDSGIFFVVGVAGLVEMLSGGGEGLACQEGMTGAFFHFVGF